jgi:hypothetical protein
VRSVSAKTARDVNSGWLLSSSNRVALHVALLVELLVALLLVELLVKLSVGMPVELLVKLGIPVELLVELSVELPASGFGRMTVVGACRTERPEYTPCSPAKARASTSTARPP